MAAQLIAKNIDAAPFYSIHHYYINKAAKAAGEEIIPLPFVEVGFKIYAASIIATDKMIAEKPDLTKRFLRAIKRSFEWARDNPEEACKLHVQKVPEVALDDCVNSVKAVMTFVFTDHEKQFGWGKVSPGAARDHLAGDRGGAGSRCELGSEQGVRHVSHSGQVIGARCCDFALDGRHGAR